MRKPIALLAVSAIASFGLVACGGSSDSSSSSTAASSSTSSAPATGNGTVVKLSADPSAIAYDTTSLSAKAGDVTIAFDNPASLAHDVCLEDSSGNQLDCTEPISSDSADLAVSDLKAGDYTFFCSVDSHREQGMEGTLKVQ